MTKDFYIKTSMNREQIKEKMISAMDLPKDVIQNASVITILGRNELCIENYRGIIEYTDTLIRARKSWEIQSNGICISAVSEG